jgi:hypothetical protein
MALIDKFKIHKVITTKVIINENTSPELAMKIEVTK